MFLDVIALTSTGADIKRMGSAAISMCELTADAKLRAEDALDRRRSSSPRRTAPAHARTIVRPSVLQPAVRAAAITATRVSVFGISHPLIVKSSPERIRAFLLRKWV